MRLWHTLLVCQQKIVKLLIPQAVIDGGCNIVDDDPAKGIGDLQDTQVNITIYDIMGREVRTLVNNQQSAGYKSVVWDATNDLGQPVSAGMYLYQIQAGKFRQTKKMVLLK